METGRLTARFDQIKQRVIDAVRGVRYEPNEQTRAAQQELLGAYSERLARTLAAEALHGMGDDPHSGSGIGFSNRGE